MATTTTGKNKQVDDAKAAKAANAKKKVAKEDPNFMPNIEPQVGKKAEKDAPKGSVVEKQASNPPARQSKSQRIAEAKRAKKSSKNVRIDPNLPLILGNSVTFVADEGEGRVMAKLQTGNGGVHWIAASNDHGDARISWIVQTKGEVSVEFYDDGKKYASGEFTVA